jgi:hypothetical protein
MKKLKTFENYVNESITDNIIQVDGKLWEVIGTNGGSSTSVKVLLKPNDEKNPEVIKYFRNFFAKDFSGRTPTIEFKWISSTLQKFSKDKF